MRQLSHWHNQIRNLLATRTTSQNTSADKTEFKIQPLHQHVQCTTYKTHSPLETFRDHQTTHWKTSRNRHSKIQSTGKLQWRTLLVCCRRRNHFFFLSGDSDSSFFFPPVEYISWKFFLLRFECKLAMSSLSLPPEALQVFSVSGYRNTSVHLQILGPTASLNGKSHQTRENTSSATYETKER